MSNGPKILVKDVFDAVKRFAAPEHALHETESTDADDYSKGSVDAFIAKLNTEHTRILNAERDNTEHMRRVATKYKAQCEEAKQERDRFRKSCERWAECCDSWEAAYKAIKASNNSLIEASLRQQAA